MNHTKIKAIKETLKIEKAVKKILDKIEFPKLASEFVPIEEALGRILAENLKSPKEIPQFDKSAVDGYAVVAENTFGASLTNPLIIRKVGQVKTGDIDAPEVKDGEAVLLYTGSRIPKGANAVLMIEYTNIIDNEKIEIHASVAPGQNVSKSGEDVKSGELILKKGTRLKPQDLGMLVALGLTKVDVLKKPKIALLSTGSELIPPGSEDALGRTIDVNRIIISSMARVLGAEVIDLGIAKDDVDEIKSKIKEGMVRGDLIIVTGGTSVGDTDLTLDAINSIDKPQALIHGISVRPGKPTGLAILKNKFIASLSGYPVAAMIGFEALVKPILIKLMGIFEDTTPIIRAKLTRRITSPLGEKNYVRVRIEKSDGEFIACPVRSTGSGIISSMIRANGFLIIPEDREGIDEEEIVEILLFRPIDEVI
ncbi:MAG: molybdopterin molybdotransferase MoeA [Candidatus Bathyarchaeota archaeon]|nr:molybdopterin molybdotransferase MoeA [Candidatus Bathyarchaeota archaeon]